MPYDRDYTTEVEIDDGTGCISPSVTFSTWLNHPDDLPCLTLETLRLGGLHLNREQVVAWLGKAEVSRIEDVCTPETWCDDGSDAADDWVSLQREVAA